jgi:hypothetical protein
VGGVELILGQRHRFSTLVRSETAVLYSLSLRHLEQVRGTLTTLPV